MTATPNAAMDRLSIVENEQILERLSLPRTDRTDYGKNLPSSARKIERMCNRNVDKLQILEIMDEFLT